MPHEDYCYALERVNDNLVDQNTQLLLRIGKIKDAVSAIEINAEEAIDSDGHTAVLVSIEDYDNLIRLIGD